MGCAWIDMNARLLKSSYPHLFEEVLWPWGPTRALFELLEALPAEALISNINITPHTPGGWVMLGLADGSWEIPGGTREPGEAILETARRELLEEAGARLLSLRIFGGWRCHSLAEKPYRPHLPHPEYYRLVGIGEVEITGPPGNPAGAEQVAKVEVAPLELVTARFAAAGRDDLAEVYRLANIFLRLYWG